MTGMNEKEIVRVVGICRTSTGFWMALTTSLQFGVIHETLIDLSAYSIIHTIHGLEGWNEGSTYRIDGLIDTHHSYFCKSSTEALGFANRIDHAPTNLSVNVIIPANLTMSLSAIIQGAFEAYVWREDVSCAILKCC